MANQSGQSEVSSWMIERGSLDKSIILDQIFTHFFLIVSVHEMPTYQEYSDWYATMFPTGLNDLTIINKKIYILRLVFV